MYTFPDERHLNFYTFYEWPLILFWVHFTAYYIRQKNKIYTSCNSYNCILQNSAFTLITLMSHYATYSNELTVYINVDMNTVTDKKQQQTITNPLTDDAAGRYHI